MVKELIPMDDMGVMVTKGDERILVDSRIVAEYFEKQHKNVIQDIERLIGMENVDEGLGLIDQPYSEDTNVCRTKSGLSLDFVTANFIKTSYVDSIKRTRKCYLMTRDGFTVLAMGYLGPKAMQFKEEYIRRFNEMEEQLEKIRALRDQYPRLTDALQEIYDNPKFYVYSNEADMLNKIAFGMTAKQYREKYGIEKSEPIRPHLDKYSAELLEHLQRIDVGLVYSMSDFQQRRQKLEWCAMKWKEKHPRENLIEEMK